MSILDRDVFNEYNLNYDPVGLRGISLPTYYDLSKEQVKFICEQISIYL